MMDIPDELPSELYEEHDGQRLVLNSEKVLAFIKKLVREAEEEALFAAMEGQDS